MLMCALEALVPVSCEPGLAGVEWRQEVSR